MSKNVLSILYFFPPMGGSGVQRTLKFVKYMPQFGYNPIVATIKAGHNFAYDETLLLEVPKSVVVYRSNSGETLWVRNIIEKLSAIRKPKVASNEDNKNSSSTTVSKQSSPGLKERAFRFIELNLLVPDSKIRWYKHAVKDVYNILKKEDIQYIFSSSYPYTVHLIALQAKKKTNLTWVADFRDPWIGNSPMTVGHSEKRKKKEEKLEAEVVAYADKIIMVTEPICENYKKRYPQYKDKFVTITNGFDANDFEKVKVVKEEKFTICYSGIVAKGQTPETLLKATERLFNEDDEYKNNIKIKFIGFILDEYINLIAASSIYENFEKIDYMPHSQCISHMKGADINLIILSDEDESRTVFSGKIFDYIGSQRPILGIMPSNGVASNLIIDKEIGYSYDHGDVDGVYNFIKSNYEKWKNKEDTNTNAAEKCVEFERKNLTNQLVNLFQ
ncbi:MULTISPECIES: glycosyltransferase [Clostridium]|uniref:glycosyltransferase n=1 Tax=Clostridium TaxID=1485 RepID=UPI0013E964FD|nr:MULTISPECIES: glycosyltransferase [Clostridium]MBU3126085.1 glycosyltransferase [Clostridium tagluense]MBZ9635305.1 glycosyltransferase [Clostridium sp. FP1]